MADDDYYAGADSGADDDEVCKVFDAEDGFTSFVQALLAVIALVSLYLKRQQEQPRRKFWTWFMDVSKQAFGACYAHVLNMAIAAILADNTRGDAVLEDECAWYAINYVIDCTLGLVLSIAGLKLLDYVANKADWVSLMHSGVYVGRRGILHWINQMIAWIIILTVTKVVVCVFMWLTSEWLAIAGAWLFEPFQVNIRFELLFVMIFFPGFMNIIYFWITDSYLKAAGHHKHAHESMDEEDDDDNRSVALTLSQSFSMVSHSHTFDMIDTGGRIREALDMCGPPVADSIHQSAVYDPKTETLMTRQQQVEMYGVAQSSAGGAGSDQQQGGGYERPPIPPTGSNSRPSSPVPASGGGHSHNHTLDVVDTGGNVAEALGVCGPSVTDSVRSSSPSETATAQQPSGDPSPREIV
mmetsp:Transcript_29612/g.86256  ORF Transcript_29612/g.86256 Transcript_29612/m.86256 type:complete len:411 (-) Transcript_29612:1136-2368(-)